MQTYEQDMRQASLQIAIKNMKTAVVELQHKQIVGFLDDGHETKCAYGIVFRSYPCCCHMSRCKMEENDE